VSSEADLLAALEPVVAVFDRLGIDYQLGGSVASSVYGMARATMDVDLVAAVAPEHVEPIVAALATDYYVDDGMIREAIAHRSSFNLIHQPTMLKVDVFLPKARAYDRQALARRVRDRLEDSPGAREFYFATAEDVVLAKLEWFDRGGRSSERQWNDILGVLRVQGEAIDVDYLRRWAADLALEELLARALRER
jgi:hypothetical protein